MEVTEVTMKKVQLDRQISEMLNAFASETRTHVASIDIGLIDMRTVNDRSKRYAYEVRTTVEIC